MSWILRQYKDKLTDKISHREIIPLGEDHVSNQDCKCIPSIEITNGVKELIHNSFDGRELLEPGNKEIKV